MWLRRLRRMRSIVILKKVMNIQVCLCVGKLGRVGNFAIYSYILLLILTLLSFFSLSNFRIFGLTNWFFVTFGGSKCCNVLRFFARLLALLEVDFASGYLRSHVPFPDLAHSFPTVKTTAHTGQLVRVHNLVAFSMHFLLLVCIVENLWANVITYATIFVLIFVICECAASALLLLVACDD